jgi:hypothetical protein
MPFLEDADDSTLKVKGMAIKNGYMFQDYKATTDDGYILGIHRIPGKLGEGNRPQMNI